MQKSDISFFEELEGVLANKRISIRDRKSSSVVVKDKSTPKEKKQKEPKAKALLNLLTLHPVADPCNGCPFEGKPKQLIGIGNLETAKLLVVSEKVVSDNFLPGAVHKKYEKFKPLFEEIGFNAEKDIYWTHLTRCCGQEDTKAIEHCVNYLRQELQRPNIKASLLLGLRPFQLLIDKDRATVFKARGHIFTLMDKPCLVTFAEPND